MGNRQVSHTHLAEIRRVADCLSRLAQGLDARNSELRVQSLWPRDFELIRRYPKTAEIFRIIVPDVGPIRWRQFVLKTAVSAKEANLVAPRGPEYEPE